MTLITYRRQLVAIAGADRFYLAPAIDELPDGDSLDGLHTDARTLLLGLDMLTDDDLEHAYRRRIVGYHETIRARPPTAADQSSLSVTPSEPVLAMTRLTRTTTDPVAELSFIARSDRFEVDYLIEP